MSRDRKKKPGLRVEYIHIGILLGYVMDTLLGAVIAHPELDTETKSAVLRAFNKVIWIQNDRTRFFFFLCPAFFALAANSGGSICSPLRMGARAAYNTKVGVADIDWSVTGLFCCRCRGVGTSLGLKTSLSWMSHFPCCIPCYRTEGR